VSYESPEFQEFALCILQKHNCLENHAVIPPRPDPGPMTHFRGEALTHEMAEEVRSDYSYSYYLYQLLSLLISISVIINIDYYHY
jgi:hypothetical protein